MTTRIPTEAARIHWMPSGKPCPEVMTIEDVIEFLRIDGKAPHRTIEYYRARGLLKGVQIGRDIRFPLDEVLAFVQNKIKEEPR